MLKFSAVSLRRGTRELLHDVSCIIHRGQNVGLTGANGVGKSSLFALVRGELHADSGEVSLPPKTVIAHVAQESPAVNRSALDYVLDGDQELRAIEAELLAADRAGDGETQARLYARLEAIDGYSAPSRAARLLDGLGFSTAQEVTPVREFSGGWRMRLNLAQALMCRSDLLLLDEPTNHLDLDAVIWLEDWLSTYPGTLLLISHDRDFLDRVTTHIAHIEHQTLTLYTGNYSAFEQRRAERLAGQQAAHEKQQREMAKMQRFVERFKAKASKAKQAQSRLKALERMTVISQAHIDSPFNFSFYEPVSRTNPVLRLDDVSVSYDDISVLTGLTLTINEGDRIGLLGHNGAGKSTLIKLLAGKILPGAGRYEAAAASRIGYFAQHQLEQLDAQASPLEHLQRLDRNAREQELRNFLGGFAFHGDMATTGIAPLSGGEKARLVLALIVYQRPNLLLLDEPTNHLDLDMRHALSTALQDFIGAMVVVSHDRHLLRTVADQLLLVDKGRVQTFDGDLDDYRRWVRESAQDQVTEKSSSTAPIKKLQRQQAAEQRRQLQPLQNRIKKLEQDLEKLHQQRQSVHERLLDIGLYVEENKAKLTELLQRQRDIDMRIDTLEGEWMSASEELEQHGC